MGLIYDPSDSRSVMDALTANLGRGVSTLTALDDANARLVASLGGELSGQAYGAARDFFQEKVGADLKDVRAVLDAVRSDLDRFQAEDARVSPYGLLNEDDLTAQIHSCMAMKEATDQLIETNRQVATVLVALPAVGAALSIANNGLRMISDGLTDRIRALEQKQDALRGFAAAIAGLFQPAPLGPSRGSGTSGGSTGLFTSATTSPDWWQTTLQAMSPQQISTWWASLDPTQQERLLTLDPGMFGALDGMPAMARVRANQLNATNQVRAAQHELAEQIDREHGRPRGDRGAGQPHSDEARMRTLRQEIEYLQKVKSGAVQLYLYDRDQSRIIEMIGTPTPDTRHVISYVPGTFTSMSSFYPGGTQQVAKYLTRNVPGTVAFVYKDGMFPGEDNKTGSGNMLRVGEANDEAFARASGQQLASFEAGMRTDPLLGAAEQVGIGHSWGLANVTSSEVAGAHYDKVISLSGAGMLPEWTPGTGTEYSNLYYQDILTQAQGNVDPFTNKGLVWNGNNPIYREEFAEYLYQGPHDDEVHGAINTPGELDILANNHNLIATNSPDNDQALRQMRKLLQE